MGVSLLLIVGIAALIVILLPTVFRSLDEESQFRMVRRFPFMATWQFRPTLPFESLPTLASTSDSDALALLLTPVISPTNTEQPPTFTPTPVPTDTTTRPPTSTFTAAPTSTHTPSATATFTFTFTASPTHTALPPTLTPTATATVAPTVISTGRSLTSTATDTASPTRTTVPPTFTTTATPTNTPTDTPSLTATFTPTLSATPPPTNTHVPTATATATFTPTVVPLPTSFHSDGYKWIPQTWNNCGPANLTQALQPFGWKGNQAEAAAFLKPDKEDKNVSPWEMVRYVNEKSNLNLRALTRVAGDMNLIKRLAFARFGVILETGFYVPDVEGWMGHYLTVIGFDESKRMIYGLDTYLGDGPDNLGYQEKYDDLDTRWRHFNRAYIVIYPREREAEVAAILGPDMDETANAQHALNTAKAEAAAKPTNQFVWFNMGSSYVLLRQYREAATAYDQASRVGGGLPFRFLWYQFGPYEAYYNIGKYSAAMALISATLQTTTFVEETYYWRGMVEAAQGKNQQAIDDFKRALKFNPNFTPAAEMLAQVQNGSFRPPVTVTPKSP